MAGRHSYEGLIAGAAAFTPEAWAGMSFRQRCQLLALMDDRGVWGQASAVAAAHQVGLVDILTAWVGLRLIDQEQAGRIQGMAFAYARTPQIVEKVAPPRRAA